MFAECDAKFHVRKDDLVQVMVGKDRGKTGKILRVLTKSRRVVVEKLNIVKVHKKKTKPEMIPVTQKEAPLALGNVLLYCSDCQRGVRTRIKLEGDVKARVCVRCGKAPGAPVQKQKKAKK